jgi:hypothetical protein
MSAVFDVIRVKREVSKLRFLLFKCFFNGWDCCGDVLALMKQIVGFRPCFDMFFLIL